MKRKTSRHLRLDVAMDDAVQVKIVQSAENLVHDRFDGVDWNVVLELVDVRLQVVVQVLKVQLDAVMLHDYTLESSHHQIIPVALYNIGMGQITQNGDLSNQYRRHALVFILYVHNLESQDFVRVAVANLVPSPLSRKPRDIHGSIGSGADGAYLHHDSTHKGENGLILVTKGGSRISLCLTICAHGKDR